MINNEARFRAYNERVTDSLDELKQMADRRNQIEHIDDLENELHFYCECSDEKCVQRIVISLSDYKDIHKKRDRFIVQPNHETIDIEEIISKTKSYSVVEKFQTPPENPAQLKQTPVSS